MSDQLVLQVASVSNRTSVFIRDAVTQQGITGLLFNTVGLTAAYSRPGTVATSIALVTNTVGGGYSSGGFVEIDAIKQPGLYQFDIPNTVNAAGSRANIVFTSADIITVNIAVDITVFNPLTIDKADFTLSSAGILALWGQLTSALVTGGSVGKLLSDYVALINTNVVAVKAKTDALTVTGGGVKLMATGMDSIPGYHPAGDA